MKRDTDSITGTPSPHPTIGVAVCTPEIQRYVQEIVSAEGIVEIYDCAEDILTQVLNGPPSVIIVETESPGFDSLQTVLAIQQHPACRQVKFLLMTSLRIQYQQPIREYFERFGLRLGYVHYIIMPFAPAELVQYLHYLITYIPPG